MVIVEAPAGNVSQLRGRGCVMSVGRFRWGKNGPRSFQEALNWIAFHNLAGMSVQPHTLGIRLTDKSYFEDWALGRLDFAVELLLDRATQRSGFTMVTNFIAIVLSDKDPGKAEFIDIDENDGKPNHPRPCSSRKGR